MILGGTGGAWWLTVTSIKLGGLHGWIDDKDRENVFSFIVNEVKKGDFPIDSKKENKRRKFEYIDKDEFYKIRKNLVKCLLVIKLDL
jgi:hypothetical protein